MDDGGNLIYLTSPHLLNPPLHDMDIYSYHEGEVVVEGALALHFSLDLS